MKKINRFIIILISCFTFLACDHSLYLGQDIYSYGQEYSKYGSGESFNQKEYDGTVNYHADNRGIHISLPLDENTINKIELYELQDTTEILMASVAPLSDTYYYALDGSPCGKNMTEVRGESESTISANWRTNYLEGTINLELPYVEPGKTYNFLLYLDEPKHEKHEQNSPDSDIYIQDSYFDWETGKTRYAATRWYKLFSLKAPEENIYLNSVSATYDSEADKFTVNSLDVKSLGLPLNIKEYSDIAFTASALYKDSLDESKSPLTVPLAVNPYIASENSLSQIAELLEDADYGADYKLAGVSGSIAFTEHLDYSINENSSAEERKAYYTQLYSQKMYVYNCPYIGGAKLPQTVIFPDKRMAVTVKAEADDNLVSFTMITDARNISIYRKAEDEKDVFLTGTMSGNFVSGETYSFPDYYAETGKSYKYYVMWDGNRRSKTAQVTTVSGMKYKPSAPAMTYAYDSENEKGVFTVTTNPFTDKLPEGYHGNIDFVYGALLKNLDTNNFYFAKEFDFSLNDTDTQVKIFKDDLSYSHYDELSEWDGYLTVQAPEKNKKKSDDKFKESYFVTISGTKDSITYTHNYLLMEKGSMPKIKPAGTKNYNDSEKIDINDIVLPDGEELYTLKPAVKGDYAEIRSISQNEDGSVAIKVYLPSWTNTMCLIKNVQGENSGEYAGTFYFDVLNHTGEITILDFDIKAGVEYSYWLSGDSVEPDSDRYYDCDYIWLPEYMSENEFRTFDKSSEYYITDLPKIVTLSEIEGDVVWNKLPDGYELMNGKVKQMEVRRECDLHDKNGNYINSSELKLCVKELIDCDYSTDRGLLKPVISYTCTEIASDDKYIKDEYENKTEKEYDENSSELQLNLTKIKYTHIYIFEEDEDKDLYFYYAEDWRVDSGYSYTSTVNIVDGTYTLKKVSIPFICDYGIWKYDSVILDHVTENKTFTKTSVETSEE